MAKILIVEDDQFLILAYRKKLGISGHDVDVAHDGEEALVILQTDRPDIILLDLLMPNMDGFELLAKIKQAEGLKDIPIIVASNLSDSDYVERAKALGAADYVVKSDLTMEDLLSKIQTTLGTSAK